MILLGLAALLAAAPAEAPRCHRGTITAVVTHVRDGDTIEVGGLPIRLNGLAAPEHEEPGGAEATAAMLELVQGRTLRCELDGEHTHDQSVGVCQLISGITTSRPTRRSDPLPGILPRAASLAYHRGSSRLRK